METEREMEWSPTTGTIASRARGISFLNSTFMMICCCFSMYILLLPQFPVESTSLFMGYGECVAPSVGRFSDDCMTTGKDLLHCTQHTCGIIYYLFFFHFIHRCAVSKWISLWKKKRPLWKVHIYRRTWMLVRANSLNSKKNAFQTAWA